MMKFVIAICTCLTALLSTLQAGENVQDITPAEAKTLISAEKPVQVLDLRTDPEFKAGHIAGAKQINFKGKDFQKQLAQLDKTKPYLIHCKSGGRSTKALPLFTELGFKKIYHLTSGFDGWKKASE